MRTPTNEDIIRAICARESKVAREQGVKPTANDKPMILKEVKLGYKSGGILTYWEGHPYPREGYAFKEAVERVDEAKKAIISLLKCFEAIPKLKMLFFAIFFRKVIFKSVYIFLQQIDKRLQLYHLRPELYCRCVREFNRTFQSKEIQKDSIARYVRRIGMMILEFDDAYRYRFQDVMGLLNREAFDKDPIDELIRLTQIGRWCEKNARLKRSWEMARLVLRAARYYPSIKKEIIFFFKNLNIEEVKLSVEDRYFARMKPDYKWS